MIILHRERCRLRKETHFVNLKPANLGPSLRASLAARVSYYSYVKVLTYICTWKKEKKTKFENNATNNEIAQTANTIC